MDRKQRAERANALLNDALLQEKIETLRERQHDAFAACSPSDVDGLREARWKLWAVEQLVSTLQTELDADRIHSKDKGSAP